METEEIITPKWLENRVNLYSKYLKLTIKIFTKLSYIPGGNRDYDAACIPLPRENSAILEFFPSIREDEKGKKTIIHELLHASMIYLDREIEDVIIPAFNCKKTEKIMQKAYVEHLESYVEHMVDVLYVLFETQENLNKTQSKKDVKKPTKKVPKKRIVKKDGNTKSQD